MVSAKYELSMLHTLKLIINRGDVNYNLGNLKIPAFYFDPPSIGFSNFGVASNLRISFSELMNAETAFKVS